MKNVVITGSTRGIGYGLAEHFLEKGCRVVVSGRREAAVDAAVARLAQNHEAARILGRPCDVSSAAEVQALWDAAADHFGQIDIWINNAGIANPQMEFRKIAPELMAQVVETNLLGAMYGSRVALNGMLAQGSGALYNMAGHGTTGRKQAGLSLYGTTKYGLRYLTDSLVLEVQDTPVIVGELRPGMVMTELITDQYIGRPEEWERARKIFNVIADRVETVAPWLVEQILANDKNGARITWLTRGKLLARFLTAPFNKRQVV